jgi:hypothetical protein
MTDKLEIYRTDVARRQEKMLLSLARGRDVFLYATELGIMSRIAGSSGNDVRTVAPFFRPWLSGRRLSCAMGGIAIEVPLLDLFLGGMMSDVLAALKETPCAKLAGLSWPNGVLRPMLNGRAAAAGQYLDGTGRSSRTSPQWLEAACHWHQFPGKRLKVMEALEEADPGDPDTETAWHRLCGDHNRAAELAESWASLHPDPNGTIRARQLKQADFWARVFGHGPSALACLTAAELDESSDGAISRFRCAMAWDGLAGERDRAVRIAEKAMNRKDEFGKYGSLFWKCCTDDPERTAECLAMPDMWEDTVGARLARIEQMMLHGTAPQEAEAMLRGIDWGSADPVRAYDWLCSGAKDWWFLFGDSEKSRETLVRAMSAAGETCDILPIAETWLDLSFLSAADRALACKEALHKAESISANPMDFVFCAQEWLRLTGDADRAAECLIKAESLSSPSDTTPEICDVWLDLIELAY